MVGVQVVERDGSERGRRLGETLDRLQRRLRTPAAHHASVEQEIAQEMASSLGRAEEKVLALLLELELLVPGCREGRERELTDFSATRRAAQQELHELCITREAVGLRNNEILGELYPIPPALPRSTLRTRPCRAERDT